jgi:hypothetical protein
VSRHLRILAAGALSVAVFALHAPGAFSAGSLGVKVWEAGTCNTNACTYKQIEEELKAKGHSDEAFTQAAGHPPWGITTFEVNSKETIPTIKEPEGSPLKRVRVDVPPGLAANPQAPLSLTPPHEKCSIANFESDTCPPGTEVGTDEAIVFAGAIDLPATGQVFNLEPEPGSPIPGASGSVFEPMPLLFGIHILTEHSFLQGHVSWAKEPVLQARGIPSGDYHEWFTLDNLGSAAPVIKSKLNFNGRAGGNFLTLPSECSSTTTNYLELESSTGELAHAVTHTPVGVEHCDKVPFAPSARVTPETAKPDEVDGAVTDVTVPQKAEPEEINTSDIKDAHLTLPEGLTLNAAAARGLQACSPAQIGIGTSNPVACPAASKVGEVTVEADLPEKSLTGSAYLGAPGGEPIKGPPYTIYVAAESAKFGVSVRLQGQVNPNPTTGRLETVFLNNPQQPASEVVLKLKGGPQAPLANPIACGAPNAEALFTPYTGEAAHLSTSPFATTGCPSPIPFSLNQSTNDSPSTAGGFAAYTFNLTRAPGQQYLSSVSTVLPPGLVGLIPSVTLCGEPEAQSGSCPAASQIGTASVTVGAGSEPYPFTGPVYLTGPYNGAPYGLSIPVEAAAGPFDLGRVTTRATIGVDPHTARVIATSTLPRIVGGVPLRLRSVSVAVNRPNFLLNPTNCGELHTESVLTSTFNASSPVSTPFQVAGCSALAFKPTFSAATNAKPTKLNGAALTVTMTQPAHEANLRSVVATLPLQLPSRLTTLQKACLQATFDANPSACAPAKVGTATAFTPALPTPLTGSAYLVSHGGAAFPDLDLVLEGSGVRVILVGNTNIKNGITTSTFASIPDVPVSKFVLDLPMGPHSALTAYGSLCARPLLMPTTITAQSGTQIKQNTRISVKGCGVRILSRRVRGHKLVIKVRTPSAGKVIVKAKGLRSRSRRVSKAATLTFKLPLTRAGLASLHRHRPLRVKVRVSFAPRSHSEGRSAASTSVKFKH